MNQNLYFYLAQMFRLFMEVYESQEIIEHDIEIIIQHLTDFGFPWH